MTTSSSNDLKVTTNEVENRMAKVYIAGPMSGIADFNRPAFVVAADVLRERGFNVVTPADCFNGDSWEEGMKHDIPAMLKCDRVSLLDGWERSRGARLEVFIARELGMHVERLSETLQSVNGKATPRCEPCGAEIEQGETMCARCV